MFSIKQGKFPTKLFIIVALANFIILAGLFVFFKAGGFNKSDRTAERIFFDPIDVSFDPMLTVFPDWEDMINEPIISGFDPILGQGEADVYLVIFSDFLCAYCQSQEKILKQIVNEYQGRVHLVWKDFPEVEVNSKSWQASLAGRCADEQGKFWEYHDLLYALQGDLNQDNYLKLAKDLNLNLNVFKDCLRAEETAELVEDNILEAQALGIMGIPFIFVNEKSFFGEVSYEELKQLIEAELN